MLRCCGPDITDKGSSWGRTCPAAVLPQGVIQWVLYFLCTCMHGPFHAHAHTCISALACTSIPLKRHCKAERRRMRDELCFFLISGPLELTPPHHPDWTKALPLIESFELSWNFISSGQRASGFTTRFARTNIDAFVMTRGDVLQGFDVHFFFPLSLPHSDVTYSSVSVWL